MGLLVDGVWQDKWYDTKATGGRFVRKDSQFRSWVTKDGEAGPTGDAGFKAEAGRYHLYISLACPWASRTLIMRKLKGLEDIISLSIVNPYMLENGWTFAPDQGVIADPILNADYLYQVYTHADPNYSGRVTVPVLYDKKTDTIVNNESSEIMLMFNEAFDEVGATPGDFYPEALRDQIKELDDYIYPNINNGVYKAGFATDQKVYEEEVANVFAGLEKMDQILADKKYLLGDQLTTSDIRLFTTLIRFEHVYYGHFKCNIKHLTDFENVWRYTREIYNLPGIAETVDFYHIQHHYYGSHPTINPNGIVPAGPAIDFSI
ncbi:glutathione S-transferase family protein [Aerococcus agrisoli]|uniref:Glutathione S-transferase family protein n=1 Tax=Aerococcus agrisoli TaxID=2487350 RepID=A0A3N4GCG9_9LACT|nr:glutathione S-transferase family protein [Aerococcus agrisoli]RPA60503.1 glutathione S-transferase family protein [Aerococcus agrisoli]